MEGKDILILSFSHSGNNDALAHRVAEELGARHERILPRRKSMPALMLDLLLGRVPRVTPLPEIAEEYGFLILCSPVWMGKPLSPLRVYLEYLKKHPLPYCFLSINGMGEGNAKVEADLTAWAGKPPVLCINAAIKDFMVPDITPDTKKMMDYRLTEDDVASLTGKVLDLLHTVV
ncbi:flavodoxin family protein [Parasphaerochaeta coccoides]|uniref:NADPH-dependent FMN reductase-like domain-containing protein n=1 Tax=Parasphaerochaeta coccoides (strain ATCC BAA-1237 / DSM 17374 / SPN1) TaxID=760011 RepID=F4GM23_PARC1|nr:flavodoxin family protein [Parasphaerochaeta coccoides]AEC02498.1 hypothetical protein Spico_1290 [Parasphaerochaeta coccoides DSM 17374]